MENKKKIYLSIGILIVIVLVIGISYALWTFNIAQSGVNTITSGCLKLEMTNENNAINLASAYPITDEAGLMLTPYEFTITNSCNTDTNYNVSLEMMEVEEKLSSKYIAISIDNQNKQLLSNLEETELTYKKSDYTPYEGRLLLNGTLKGNESKTHTLRIWMDEATPAIEEAMNKNFISKVVVSATISPIYKESILNGADPVLADNLIPVVIDNTGTVTKADTNSEWYSYEDKRWANAVILLDDSITYEDGETIPESNIESYFVWIPKYSYQLWSLEEYDGLTEIDTSKVHEIPIKFGLSNTNDSNSGECTTPMTSGGKGNCVVGDYMTHPAFISMNTNGLWVGKFETGYKEATSTAGAQVNANDSSKVIIKPNVYSWRNIQISNAFYTSYNYQRDLDSHMMKNTEWGAVAYLQHSAYGSATSVRINNNSAFITGYAAKNEPTTGYTGTNIAGNIYESTSLGVDGTNTYNYKSPLSQVASTTGNYSGIYDMSGGALEYVMGVMLDSTNTTPYQLNAGFTTFPEAKYYDTYIYRTSDSNYISYILGDAIGELGPFASKSYASLKMQMSSWYEDEAWNILTTYPWFRRGNGFGNGVGSGMFAIHHHTGENDTYSTFRIVLGPTV